MLTVSYQGEIHNFPCTQAELVGRFSLEQDWREKSYALGGSCLDLLLELVYSVPESVTGSALEKYSAMELSHDSLVWLELEFDHTEYDVESGWFKPTAELALFPAASDLEGRTLSQALVQEALLWCPISTGRADFQEIRFGRMQTGGLPVCIDATAYQCGLCVREESVPFTLEVGLWAGPGNFPGWDLDRKFSEIEECFASLYDVENFSAERRILDPSSGDVKVRFSQKVQDLGS